MENDLEQLRRKIDTIDTQLCKLFVERMHIVKNIICVKINKNIAITNQSRETEIIKKQVSLLQDSILEKECVDFLKSLIAISKTYQQKIVGEQLQNGTIE